jgi:hypothetical protein
MIVRRFCNLAINLSLSLVSIVIYLTLCELVVFRYIWLASDIPRLDYVDDVVRYAPSQTGVWRLRNQIASPYRINRQGWNSGVGDYGLDRDKGVLRVAVVGDSIVEAFHVGASESLAEVLGRDLTQDGRPTEVFRFGISGAPLSQYVHMVERVVLQYRPDWIVVVVIHNDFDESFHFMQGRYTSSFMKFRLEGGKVIGEIPPTPWRKGFVDIVRQTATARFFIYRWQVRPQALVDLILPSGDAAAEGKLAGNVEIDRVLAQRRDVTAVAEHASARLAALANSTGAQLVFVMDGDRQAIYREDNTSLVLQLNQILADAAAQKGIDLIDMHPVFAEHWSTHHQRFEFASDGHWNALAHALVAGTVAKYINRRDAQESSRSNN